VTIGARCAGSTPDCGIENPKSPEVDADSKAVLDASYYINNPWNKVPEGHDCYPGPISAWDTPPRDELKCRDPFANGHAITCGPYPNAGTFDFEACGAGLCGSISVKVR
jgi:hypothetical protein